MSSKNIEAINGDLAELLLVEIDKGNFRTAGYIVAFIKELNSD